MVFTDKEILQLIISRDKIGIEFLFNKYFPIVSKTAYIILKDEEASKDLSQDLFLKLWTDQDKLKNVSNLKAYLLTSIRNLSLNYLYKNENEKKHIQEYIKLSFDPSYTNLEDNRPNLRLFSKVVAEELSKLQPQCRLIFSLNRFEGLSNQEIADYLSIAKTTVEKQISIAMKHLRQSLKHHNCFYDISLLFLTSVSIF